MTRASRVRSQTVYVDIAELEVAFPGVTTDGGEFRAHLELAALAIALKRRVIVLQGVEVGQDNEDNPFENFVRSLRDDHQRIADLEGRVENVLCRLSAVGCRRSSCARLNGSSTR